MCIMQSDTHAMYRGPRIVSLTYDWSEEIISLMALARHGSIVAHPRGCALYTPLLQIYQNGGSSFVSYLFFWHSLHFADKVLLENVSILFAASILCDNFYAYCSCLLACIYNSKMRKVLLYIIGDVLLSLCGWFPWQRYCDRERNRGRGRERNVSVTCGNLLRYLYTKFHITFRENRKLVTNSAIQA